MTTAIAHRPVVLVILDGWGIAPPGPGNAIALADTPTFDRILSAYPNATLRTSGLDVGLVDGQMGNSEVGHLNLGAGFVVNQTLTRIKLAIDDGSLFTNPTLNSAIEQARSTGSTLHLMGLVSDGGVHSHLDHLIALLELCHRQGVADVAVHAFLDGRDTSPHGGADYLTTLLTAMETVGTGRLASVVGRYYAMDRDHRWERTKIAMDLLVSSTGDLSLDPVGTVRQRYADGVTDEFMTPIAVGDPLSPGNRIKPGDVAVFFNFRADRARQLSAALTGRAPEDSGLPDPPADLTLITLTEYDPALPATVAYAAETVEYPLARVVSEAGLRQFHSAETEKYAHVTYFFNGGTEQPYPGEERGLVPSPKVPTYDLQPEMSAPGIADVVCQAIAGGEFGFIVLNFANCDMVGHTGVISAAVAATSAVDHELGRVLEATLAAGGVALVTADHGNAEQLLTTETNQPMTAHTTNPVPVILVAPEGSPLRKVNLRHGRLADVAPTVLQLLGVDQPAVMTGQSLIELV